MNKIFNIQRNTNVYLGSPTDSRTLKLLDASIMGGLGHRKVPKLINLHKNVLK